MPSNMTIIDHDKWRFFKQRFWNRIWSDLEIGYLDEDLLPILIRLNMDQHIYTMSSCSGRIVLSDSTYPWSREETSVIFKKHGLISVDELLNIINKPIARRLWINVSGPIIHLSLEKPSYVREILRLAREAGLKHSGLLSINRYKGFIIELMSGVKMTQLLKTRAGLLISIDSIEQLVEVVNETYMEGRKILIRLYRAVDKEIPYTKDREILADLCKRNIDLKSIEEKLIKQ